MTVYDKLAMDTKATIHEKREKERASRELEGCTFRPLINHWVAPPTTISPRRGETLRGGGCGGPAARRGKEGRGRTMYGEPSCPPVYDP